MEVEVKPIKQPHHAAALRAAFPATLFMAFPCWKSTGAPAGRGHF